MIPTHAANHRDCCARGPADCARSRRFAQQSVNLGLGQLHAFDKGLGKACNHVSMLFEYLTRLLKADLAKARSCWFVEIADEIVDFTHVGYRANVVCGGVEQLLSITTSGADGYPVHERNRSLFLDVSFAGCS